MREAANIVEVASEFTALNARGQLPGFVPTIKRKPPRSRLSREELLSVLAARMAATP